jgi:hypothetical protein
MSDSVGRAKQILWDRYRELNPGIHVDRKGYISDFEWNLLKPEWMQLIKGDYDRGNGRELEWKFRAVHSSAALTANHFAPFKRDPGRLILLGRCGLESPIFEKQLPTGLRGIPPNVDVFCENSEYCIAIESKLLETLTPKKPYYPRTYSKEKLPTCEPQWWDFIESAPSVSKGFLDTAQLVKHYLGLIHHLQEGKINKKAILLYLYWKPANSSGIREFEEHDRELEEFKKFISGSSVEFTAMTYRELWETWSKEPSLADHARRLGERYSVEI